MTSRISAHRPVLAASAACFRNGKLLLVRRAAPPELWTLPGGRVEPGEAAAEAARRELREETGVEGDIVGFAGHRVMTLRDVEGALERHFVILSFAVRWRAGDGQVGEELAALEWIEPSALARFQTTEGLSEIVESARRLAWG
jgi:ADP-ribose pyrophosphatase YjhB (NUDIX family)